MLNDTHKQSLAAAGYVQLTGYWPTEQLGGLTEEFEALVKRYYNREQLERHSVYPSDVSEARVSHAMMLSEGPSDLPKVDHSDFPLLTRFLHEQNRILEALTGHPVAPGARSLLNFQSYFSGSKPVGEHFDGEYLRAERQQDGVEFSLLEGILPRFVGVMVLKNENDGRGIEIVDNARGAVHALRLHPGDLVLFDNINLRHRVPRLDKPRTTIGLRNFDHRPLHFARTPAQYLPGATYRPIAEGFVSEDADCHARFQRYLREEWPALKDSYGAYV